MSNTTGELSLKITADVGQVNSALNKLEKDSASAGNAASANLGKIEKLLESINSAAQSAAGSLGKPFTQAAPEIEKYRSSIQRLERQVSSLQSQLDKLSRVPPPKMPEGPDVNAIKAKWDPLFAISQKYKENLAEIAAAEKAGALTSAQAANARLSAADAANVQNLALQKTQAVLGGLNSTTELTSNQLLNLSRQFGDVATMAAMGASPMQIFASQAAQIVDALQSGPGGLSGSLAAIRDGFVSVVSAIGPARIALGAAAAGAAAFWYMSGGDKADEAKKKVQDFSKSVEALKRVYEQAGVSAETFYKKASADSAVVSQANLQSTLLQSKAALQANISSLREIEGFNLEGGTLGSIGAVFGQIAETDFSRSLASMRELYGQLVRGDLTAQQFRDKVATIRVDPKTPEDAKKIADRLLEASRPAQDLQSQIKGIEQGLASAAEKAGRLAKVLSRRDEYNLSSRFGVEEPVADGVNGIAEALNRQKEELTKITPEQRKYNEEQERAKRELESYNDAIKNRIRGIQDTATNLRMEVELFGQSEGAVAAAVFQYQALEAAKRAAADANRAVSDEEISVINQASQEVEAYTNKLRAMNEERRQAERLASFEEDLNFKTQIRGLSQQDQQIAERLRSVGVDYLSVQGQQYAAQMKYNDALKQTNEGIIDFQDLGESAFDVLNDSLREGTGLLGGLMNMFAKLANQLASQAFGKLFGGLFNPGQQTGVGSGGGAAQNIVSAASATVGGVRSATAPIVNTLKQNIVPAFKNASTSMTAAAKAIRTIESGSAAGNYSAIGPATRTGDRALGAYQMMGANLPQWSREAIGREIGKVEFLRSIELQDKIFEHRFGSYMKKYGPEGASRAWFAGEGGMKNWNAKDVVGTSVNGYGSRFGKLYNQYSNDNYRTTSSIDESRSIKAGVSEGVIDAQRKISTGQAGPSLQPSTVTSWSSGGDLRTVGSRVNTSNPAQQQSSGLFSQSGLNVLGAGIGSFASGYSSGSPFSGGLTGGFSGYGAGESIGSLLGVSTGVGSVLGAVGGAALGILGGILGARKQRKEAHKQAAAKWEEMRPQYEAFDRSLSGEKQGDLRKYVTDGWSQLSSFMQVGGAAWKMGTGNSTAQFNSTGKKLFEGFLKMLNEFQEGFDDMVDDLASGQGLEGSFAKGRNAAKALSDQVKKTQDDIDIAFGNVASIDFLNTAVAQEQAAATEKARAEALERFNKAAGEYALSLLYTSRTVSEVEKTVDGLRGTAAGLQGVLKDLGWSADDAAKAIGERLAQALANIRSEFEKGVVDRINDLNGKGYFAEVREMIKEFRQLQSDAAILGADQSNFAELFRLQSQSIVDGSELTGDAFAELIRAFPELEGVVKEFSSAALKASAEEIKSAIDSYEERIFAAKNAGDELAMFDRKAAQERIEAAKYGINALSRLEQALSVERANIALSVARENLERSYQNETSNINKLLTQRQKEASELETSISSLESYTKSLESFRKSMLTDENISTLSPYERFIEAQKQFRDTAAKAAAGDEDAQAELANSSQKYLEEARSYYASSEEYYRSFEEVRKLIGEQEAKAGKQLTEQQRQLKALESQIEQGQKELEALEKQYETLLGINEGIKDLATAMREFAAAAAAAAAAKQAATVAPVGGSGGGANYNAPRVPGINVSTESAKYLANNADVAAAIAAGQTFGLPAGMAPEVYASAHFGLHGQTEGRKWATGGMVTGPGTGTSDSISARLSNGEFVTRAASVNTQTRGMLEYINRNGIVPNANDNSRMEGVERRLDRLTQTVAAGFQMNNETGMEGNKIASQQVANSKLAGSR